MKTAVAVEPRTDTPSFSDLLTRLFPTVTTRDLLRLSTGTPSGREHEWFFWRRNGGHWTHPVGVATGAGDRPETIVAANSDTTITWSPFLYGSPASTSTAPARLAAIWAACPLTAHPHPQRGFGSMIDPDSERLVLARLRAVTPAPSLILHEGLRISALWRLREPLDDLARIERLLWHVGTKLGADRTATLEPRAMTFAVPGTPMRGVFPRRDVAILAMTERDYSPDQL